MENSTKPTILYDGDCGFCQRWINKWQGITGDVVSYAPYQKRLTAYPQLTEAQCKRAVQIILPDGATHSGAHAVFTALALAKKYSWLLWFYDHVPLSGRISEFVYQLFAQHRFILSKLYRSPTCKL